MTTRVAAITCCLRPDTVTSFGMTVTDFNATLSGIYQLAQFQQVISSMHIHQH